MVEYGSPRRVELMCRRGASLSGDAVRLLDERDGHRERACDTGCRDEVGRGDPSAGAVAEDERGARTLRRVELDARGPVRRFDVQCRHFGSNTTRMTVAMP